MPSCGWPAAHDRLVVGEMAEILAAEVPHVGLAHDRDRTCVDLVGGAEGPIEPAQGSAGAVRGFGGQLRGGCGGAVPGIGVVVGAARDVDRRDRTPSRSHITFSTYCTSVGCARLSTCAWESTRSRPLPRVPPGLAKEIDRTRARLSTGFPPRS